jgi:hypothetical protein
LTSRSAPSRRDKQQSVTRETWFSVEAGFGDFPQNQGLKP